MTTTITKRLLNSTLVVSSMTMLSRLMGFARDIVIAIYFGAAAGADAFFIAFKIPNLMRRLFAEGAFSQAFVPILAEYQQQKSPQEVKAMVANIAGSLAGILAVITLLAILCAPLVIMLFAPGFATDSVRYELATDMLRLTFPYLMLISLTAMAAAVLNTYGYFAIPAFTPVLLNVSLIACAVYMAPHLQNPIEALAWGVLIAGGIQLCFLLPFLQRIDLLPWPRFALQEAIVKRLCKLMIPALFGVSVAQINILIDMVFASFLPVGSISWLYFSDRLTSFPLGVFAVAIATVIMPQLSRDYSAASHQQFSENLDWALRMVLLVAVPATLGLLLLAGPVLATLLAYGKFTDYDVYMTQQSLMALAVGVPAFMLIKVMASGFYAQQNIKTPVKIGIAAMLCNTLLNFALIGPLQHGGLALATSLAAIINVSLLYYSLRKKQIYQPQASWGKFYLQLAMANLSISAFLIITQADLALWLEWSTSEKALYLLGLVFASIIIYTSALWLLGIKFRQA